MPSAPPTKNSPQNRERKIAAARQRDRERQQPHSSKIDNIITESNLHNITCNTYIHQQPNHTHTDCTTLHICCTPPIHTQSLIHINTQQQLEKIDEQQPQRNLLNH